jgi:hypothetical protein
MTTRPTAIAAMVQLRFVIDLLIVFSCNGRCYCTPVIW